MPRIKQVGSAEEMTGALEMMVGWYISALETLPSAIRQARSDKGLRAALAEWVTNTRNALAEKAKATAKALPEGAKLKYGYEQAKKKSPSRRTHGWSSSRSACSPIWTRDSEDLE